MHLLFELPDSRRTVGVAIDRDEVVVRTHETKRENVDLVEFLKLRDDGEEGSDNHGIGRSVIPRIAISIRAFVGEAGGPVARDGHINVRCCENEAHVNRGHIGFRPNNEIVA